MTTTSLFKEWHRFTQWSSLILQDISLHVHCSGIFFMVALLWLVLLVMLQVHFWTYYCMVLIRFYHCRHNKDCFSPEQLARHPLQTQKRFINSQLTYEIGWIIQDNILWLTIIEGIALRDCIVSLEIIYLSMIIVYYFFFIFLSPNCVSLPCTWFTRSMSWTKDTQT